MKKIEMYDYELREKLFGKPTLCRKGVPEGNFFIDRFFPEEFGQTRSVSIILENHIELTIEQTYCPHDLIVHRTPGNYLGDEVTANLLLSGYHSNQKLSGRSFLDFNDAITWHRMPGELYRSFFPGEVQTLVCHLSFLPDFFRNRDDIFHEKSSPISELMMGRSAGRYELSCRTSAAIHDIIRQILTCTGSASWEWMQIEASVLSIAAEIIEISLSSSQKRRSASQTSDEDRLEEVRDYLGRNYMRQQTLAGLSVKFGLNEFKLKNSFRLLFGCTVFEYIYNLRMREAVSLLRQGGLNVAEIGRRLGYSNAAAFSSAFKRKYGVSPRCFLCG